MFDFSIAKKVEQFSEVYGKTDMEAALAACIFHRKEMPIGEIGVRVHLNI
jgi:imidazole glycerol phosphate synthase subunit HisF